MYASPPKAGLYNSITTQRNMAVFMQFVVLQPRDVPTQASPVASEKYLRKQGKDVVQHGPVIWNSHE